MQSLHNQTISAQHSRWSLNYFLLLGSGEILHKLLKDGKKQTMHASKFGSGISAARFLWRNALQCSTVLMVVDVVSCLVRGGAPPSSPDLAQHRHHGSFTNTPNNNTTSTSTNSPGSGFGTIRRNLLGMKRQDSSVVCHSKSTSISVLFCLSKET